MKAAVFSSHKPSPPFLQLEDLPSPTPSTGDVVVKVLASPVLSYTNEIFTGERLYPSLLPIVPGASGVGIIKAVGPDVTGLKPGQLVYCDATVRARDEPLWSPLLLQGLAAFGPRAEQMQAVWRNGAWAEEMLKPAESVFRIPPSIVLDAPTLALLSAVSVPFGGLHEGGVCTGSTVAITGATGYFGTAAVAVALALGARRVVPCGRDCVTLELFVNTYGKRVVPVVISGNETEDTAAIEAAAGEGFQIDVHFDILPPAAPFSIARSAIRAVRPGGNVILMGGVAGNVELPYLELMLKSITIKGVFMCPRSAFPQLIGLVEAGLLDLSEFSTKAFSLGEINEAVMYAKDHHGPFENTVVGV